MNYRRNYSKSEDPQAAETSWERRARLEAELRELDAGDQVLAAQPSAIEGSVEDDFNDVLAELDEDDGARVDWGECRELRVGSTVWGWWRCEDVWDGEYGKVPVYLMVDAAGADFFFFGGRAQLDKKIRRANPQFGDRVAVRRLEHGEAEPGQNPPWRVRVAVSRGDGSIPVRRDDEAIF